MKKLISLHEEPLSKFSTLDLEGVQKVTYLYEFDRVIQ